MPKDQKKKPTPRKSKPNVRFSSKPETSHKRKASPVQGLSPESSNKKQHRTGSQEPTAGKSTTSEGSTTGNSAPDAGQEDRGEAKVDGNAPSKKKRVRNQLGIHPKEVPKEARPTQVDDYRLHMRSLVDESRTAVREAVERATKLIREVKAVSGPIANDIARIPAEHLTTVFTMVQKAGLQGFCPDIEGPAHSTYNQLHRHLAVSAFQFLSSSFALIALNVNNYYASDHNLCTDMYNNFVYGTLAQNTKKEIRRPGSLSHALRNSVANKARTRISFHLFAPACKPEGLIGIESHVNQR
ncbi:hypothetical protein DFH07DRAFT_772291 [Mycena maculata]|uniref:Uncharacterized protein n=1 Tax=Mycena maculata TaxID=230809 RepID=A0AAD7JBJ7_9AGAR|nr:hypothetical protein DFH07DRAFT_772291 [Mycena maculata]